MVPGAAPDEPGAFLHLHDFLHECRPEWSQRDLCAVVQKLSRVGVRTVGDLRGRVQRGVLNEQLERAGERRLAAGTLRAIAGKGQPPASPAAPSPPPGLAVCTDAANAQGLPVQPGSAERSATDEAGRLRALETSATDDRGLARALEASAADDRGQLRALAASAVDERVQHQALEASATDDRVQRKALEASTTDDRVQRQALEASATDDRGQPQALEASAADGRGLPQALASAGDDSGQPQAVETSATDDSGQPRASERGSHEAREVALSLSSLECAICYEPVEQVTKLPCDCKVDYCLHCWDRAMAQSFKKCGMARCPTCRCSVRVDFDPVGRGLIFSREEEAPQGQTSCGTRTAPDAYFERTVERLARQVRPAQVQLLRSYGKAASETTQGDEAGLPVPRCVCGGALRKVTPEQRTRRVTKGAGGMEERVRRQGCIVCDLCNREVPEQCAVWECESGSCTIMHAAAYDICDGCFERHRRGSGTDCVICSKPIERVAELPCACKLMYCAQCWDEAMAQSFQASGMAHCPSCLAALRVDFDASEECLVFSREDSAPAEGGGEAAALAGYFEGTVERLAEQVRPLQLRLLQAYGRAHPPAPGWAMTGGLVETRVAQGRQAAPRCVCGSALWRLSLQERTLATAGAARSPEEDSIVCDLCDREVPPSSAVWTCENGGRTIRHATEYDICDRCFCSVYVSG